MLRPYITASNTIWNPRLKSALDTKRPVASLGKGFIRYMPSTFYPARVFFKLHGDMVSLMQALATPSSTVHKIKYLETYHESISVLAASS